jgi:hypothetical protein
LSQGITEEEYIAQEEDPSASPSPDEIAEDLSTILSEVDKQERTTRDLMLRLWKYLELLWIGSGNYYWDHMTGQWRAITQSDIAILTDDADVDPTLINKVINLIRPYGESLVGVLTTALPKVVYFPEDADDELDIQTSKAYSKVEQKIADDNFMNLRLMEILVKLWNGGFSAVYNYPHSDKKYGVFHQPITEDRPHDVTTFTCLECGNEREESEEVKLSEVTDAEEEEAPDTDKSEDEMLDTSTDEAQAQAEVNPQPPALGAMIEEEDPTIPLQCDVCMRITPHLADTAQQMQETTIGSQDIPKSRQLIKVFGPMNVKISSMATQPEHLTWLVLEEEIHVAQAKHLYPDHRDKIEAYTNSDIDIDRISRASYEISDDTLREHCTIRKVWFKPAEFERLPDVDRINFYKEKYPLGVKAIFCGEKFLEAEEEDMDEHWTLSSNPLYNKIQGEPLGKALIGLHESANDLFQQEIDTVRYSIPSVYADPEYFDFDSHAQSRALPGSISPMKRPPGGSLSDVITETKTATIPKEVENLDTKIEKLFQFISGILPPVFGGPGTGSNTLGEYQESKNQALQRLSIIWKVVSVLYAQVMAKATKNYVDNLLEDEKFVQKNGDSTFMNVWIRQSQLRGKIGQVRPELSEQFPASWGQVSARIMELLGSGNQAVIAWLLHPENIELIYKAIGIQDLKIPGEEQRNKQLFEISQLIVSEPIIPEMGMDQQAEMDPMTGEVKEPMPTSSVPIELIDDDTIHMTTLAAFLNSPMGIDLKMTNPVAYQNIMLHYMEHQERIMMMQQAEQEMGGSPEGEEEPPNEDGSEPVEEV